MSQPRRIFWHPHLVRIFAVVVHCWLVIGDLPTDRLLAQSSTRAPITSLIQIGGRVWATSDAGLQEWSYPSLERTQTFDLGQPDLNTMALAGDRMFVGGGESAVYGWLGRMRIDVPDSPLQLTPFGSVEDLVADVVYCSAVSAEGDRVAIGCLDGTTGILDLADGDWICRFPGHSSGVTGIAWLDDSLIASVSLDASVRVWRADNAMLVRTLNNHTDRVLGIAVRPGKRSLPQVASIGDDQTIRFWQPTIGRLMRFVRLDNARPTSLCWSLDGANLYVGTTDGRLLVIDPATAAVGRELATGLSWVTAVTTADDGAVMLGSAAGRVVRIEDADRLD